MPTTRITIITITIIIIIIIIIITSTSLCFPPWLVVIILVLILLLTSQTATYMLTSLGRTLCVLWALLVTVEVCLHAVISHAHARAIVNVCVYTHAHKFILSGQTISVNQDGALAKMNTLSTETLTGARQQNFLSLTLALTFVLHLVHSASILSLLNFVPPAPHFPPLYSQAGVSPQ
jgi:predicted membrane protein